MEQFEDDDYDLDDFEEELNEGEYFEWLDHGWKKRKRKDGKKIS